MKNKRLITALLVSATVAGGATAVAGFELIERRVDVEQEPFRFPTNDRGMTYGSALDATSPDNEPDLIEAYGQNGKLGYVLRSDLVGEAPASPEEAAALPRGAQTIPVYARDGITIVDSFLLDDR